ncbi:MAG: hypothetical protein AAGA08_10390 [Pseudomonadota bacterium]
MIWTIFKSILAALSLTMMMLAAVYTVQARDAKSAEPRWIGDSYEEKPFLLDYAETRKELLMALLRERFPSLNLPEPEAEPINPLSLEALKSRQGS